MGKKLSEMTKEELWQLFPITLEPPSSRFAGYYRDMSAVLKERLKGLKVKRISHIGSTAVNGIWAKPIVDILVEIDPSENMNSVANRITETGFIKMWESDARMSFNYGYTENGFSQKVFHLHLRFLGDNDEQYFRDYLNSNPTVAKEYEKLKLGLWHKFEHDRDAYTEAKTGFIKEYTAAAKTLYSGRYDK